MTGEAARRRHTAVTDAFGRACDAGPAAREAVVNAIDDARVRDEVRRLLAAGDSGTGVVDDALCTGGLIDWAGRRDLVPVGGRIGPYVVTRLIGQGGSSHVYAARQTGGIVRDVAVKVLDTPAALTDPARFAAERDALARLSYPHVVPVFDASTDDDGRPYLVMEFVDGEPVTAWAGRCTPSPAEVVAVVLQAAGALAFAHARGMIHRDVKPSNVLVVGGCDDAFARVIDFGLATATRVAGAEAAGTPAFMSPRQADEDAVADVTWDVYGLSATLYAVLAGRPPVNLADLRGAAATRVFEAVRTRPRPPLREVAPHVPDDLAAVCDCALVLGRYETMAAFADDLRRWSRGLPVSAIRATPAYRLRRWVGRHRLGATAAAAAGVLLVSGTAGTAAGFLRAQQSFQRARVENARSRQELAAVQAVTRFLTDDLLGAAVPDRDGKDVRVVDLLDRAADALETGSQPPVVDAQLRLTLGETYLRLGDIRRGCELLEAAHRRVQAATAPDDPRRAYAAVALATAVLQDGDVTGARALLLPTLDDPACPPLLGARAVAVLADAASRSGELRRAADLAADALARMRSLPDVPPLLLSETINLHAVCLDDLGDSSAILAAPAEITALLGEGHVHVLGATANAAASYLDAGRPADALPLLESAWPRIEAVYGPDHYVTLIVAGNRISALTGVGRTPEAVEAASDLVTRVVGVHGASSQEAANQHHRLAAALLADGRPREAYDAAEAALRAASGSLDDDHWMVGQFLSTRAVASRRLGDVGSARRDWQCARVILASALGDDHPRTRSVDARLRELAETD